MLNQLLCDPICSFICEDFNSGKELRDTNYMLQDYGNLSAESMQTFAQVVTYIFHGRAIVEENSDKMVKEI